MAKILKVKVARTYLGDGRIKFNYPAEYEATKIEVTAYEHIGDNASVEGRGNAYEYCIGVVSDTDAQSFLASEDIIELTQEDANILGSVYRPQIDVVKDAVGIAVILAKLGAALDLSSHLTQEELDAINPDSAANGINRTPAFSKLLTNTLTKAG
jgi:hypothetical protein